METNEFEKWKLAKKTELFEKRLNNELSIDEYNLLLRQLEEL